MIALKVLAVCAATSFAEQQDDGIASVQWVEDKADDEASKVNPALWDGDESALRNVPQEGTLGGFANSEDAGEEPVEQDLVRDGQENNKDYYGMSRLSAHTTFGEAWIRRAWRRCYFFDCHGYLQFAWSDWHCGCGNSVKLWLYCVRLQNRMSWRRYWNYYRFMRCGNFLPFGTPGDWWNRFGACGNCVWCRHHPKPIVVVKRVPVPVQPVVVRNDIHREEKRIYKATTPAPSPWPAPAPASWNPTPAPSPWPAPAPTSWKSPAPTSYSHDYPAVYNSNHV